jgi:hypothetical protein
VVQDTISNRSFTIGAGDDVLQEQLLAKIPASASTEGAQPRGHQWWVIGGTIAAVVFVLFAIRRRLAPRRLTKHSIIFVGLLPLLLNSTLIWADVTVPLDQLTVHRRDAQNAEKIAYCFAVSPATSAALR